MPRPLRAHGGIERQRKSDIDSKLLTGAATTATVPPAVQLGMSARVYSGSATSRWPGSHSIRSANDDHNDSLPSSAYRGYFNSAGVKSVWCAPWGQKRCCTTCRSQGTWKPSCKALTSIDVRHQSQPTNRLALSLARDMIHRRSISCSLHQKYLNRRFCNCLAQSRPCRTKFETKLGVFADCVYLVGVYSPTVPVGKKKCSPKVQS